MKIMYIRYHIKVTQTFLQNYGCHYNLYLISIKEYVLTDSHNKRREKSVRLEILRIHSYCNLILEIRKNFVKFKF